MSAHRILGLNSVPRVLAVRQLKRYASWVQNVVRTVRSLSVVGAGYLRGAVPSTRGPGWTNLWCTSCHAQWHSWAAMFGSDKR